MKYIFPTVYYSDVTFGVTKGLITWAGLARLAGLVWVRRDLSMFVKRNKNQLRDYMTTGPAHTKAARLTGPARLM